MADADLLASVAKGIPPRLSQVGVAVSGGGDSLALLHLLSRVAPQRGLTLRAVTVDHRLRPESAAEAAFAGAVCARLGVPHDVLVWDHGPLGANLMELARNARRCLMADWARAAGVHLVALGHTADDQAEGLLMALLRESGLDGLSGMPPLRHDAGLIWARPLLMHSRAGLRDYLTRHGETWIDDPTNADPKYLRVQARAAVAGLAAMGLQPENLAASAGFLALARGALDHALARFAAAHITEIAGALEVNRAAFDALDPETQRRLLVASVLWIGGAAHPPRRQTQGRALAALQGGQGVTLGGVRIRVGPQAVRLAREPRAVGGAVPVGQVWDGRWRVTGPKGDVRAVGADGLRQIAHWRAGGVPRDALVASPGIWLAERLIAAPLAGFGTGYSATIGRSFGSFLLSH